MTSEEKGKITDLKKCDFSEMHQYFKAQSEARKAMTKEEKLVRLNTLSPQSFCVHAGDQPDFFLRPSRKSKKRTSVSFNSMVSASWTTTRSALLTSASSPQACSVAEATTQRWAC